MPRTDQFPGMAATAATGEGVAVEMGRMRQQVLLYLTALLDFWSSPLFDSYRGHILVGYSPRHHVHTKFMASTAKPHPLCLRRSCDGCFLAKVNYSKARPICSRYLACGIECRYSPSSRAGKPKSDNSNHHNSSSMADINGLSSLPDDKSVVFMTQPASAASLFRLELAGTHREPSRGP